jgi:hypothetical protein
MTKVLNKLKRPQTETASELDALLTDILDRAWISLPPARSISENK